MCFTDTKIFKLLHDFPQVLHVSFLLELESIKYVHRVFSNSCQKYSALKLIVVSLLFESFHKKDICHWPTAGTVVADGFAVLAFFRSLHHSLLVSKFCCHS